MKSLNHSLRRFTLVLQPEPEGGYTVTVPQLPGCVTYGRTLKEARAMAADAIQGYLDSLTKHDEGLPFSEEPFVTSLDLTTDR